MSEISEVYSKDTYLPFLAYCREQSFEKMSDLSKCPFHSLSEMPGFTTMLASRVRAVYTTYFKLPPMHVPAAPKPQKAMTEPELVNFLHKYFMENGQELIKLVDVVKATNGRARRGDINKILQQVNWCQVVDKMTFFHTVSK